MRKVLHVAVRDFLATVTTRGFLIGVLITPALIAVMILVFPRLLNDKTPSIAGEVAVLDPTGQVTGGLRVWLDPEAIAARRAEAARREHEKAAERTGGLTGAPGAERAAEMAAGALLGEVPKLDVAELAAGADLEREKEPLKLRRETGRRIALVVIHADAVVRRPDAEDFGSYDLYVRGKLDDRIEDEIRDGLRRAIVDARIRSQGLDRGQIEALTRVPRVRSVSVTVTGERRTSEALNAFLPAGFMVLLLVSVLSSGQQLLTTTIEEKSSRVVEMLLSAVSPMQLMAGKILGQLAVGLCIMVLYSGLGIATLFQMAQLGYLDMSLFLYLVLFYLIAYIVVGSMYAAIGAAVNELREAQSLLTPLTLVVMVPWIFWAPITRDPNSTFSTVISFIPPINTFTMLLRLTSTSPPPAWQVWVTIAIGIASAWAALWFAAKVFRIGLLMYGKPPNFATLVRWVRMA